MFIVAARIAASVVIEQQYGKADIEKPTGELPIGTVRVDVFVPQRVAENQPAISPGARPWLMIAAIEWLVGCTEIEGYHVTTSEQRAVLHKPLQAAPESGT